VAHLGQAKADAGTGYELMAITAVVLGGASIFGGRGTVLGTVLGLFAIAILQNGLRLSGAPAELAGILTGTLLVATILLDRCSRGPRPRRVASATPGEEEVKNSQLVALSAVILTAALLVVGGNWLVARSLRQELHALAAQAGGASKADAPSGARKPIVAMMPKAKGDPYFISCRKGAEQRRARRASSCSGTARPISTPPSRTRWSRPGSRAAST
jgi:rhamnose transport system permease protein